MVLLSRGWPGSRRFHWCKSSCSRFIGNSVLATWYCATSVLGTCSSHKLNSIFPRHRETLLCVSIYIYWRTYPCNRVSLELWTAIWFFFGSTDKLLIAQVSLALWGDRGLLTTRWFVSRELPCIEWCVRWDAHACTRISLVPWTVCQFLFEEYWRIVHRARELPDIQSPAKKSLWGNGRTAYCEVVCLS